MRPRALAVLRGPFFLQVPQVLCSLRCGGDSVGSQAGASGF